MNHTTHDVRVTDNDIQATFLSLQDTVAELVREHSYITVYDEYTPQSFVENGKKLVDKIVAIIKRVFDWVVGLFSNRSNSLKKTKQELDSSIKAAKEVKTPPPPQKTDVEKYIELLQKWGYAIDGKWVPIRLFNESISVMGQLQSQINKNREYLEKYSKLLSDADSQAVDFDPTDHHLDKLQKKFTDFYAILIPLNKSGDGGRYELHPPVVPRRRDLSKHAFNENTIHALPDRAFVLEAAECASTTMANMLQGLVRSENICKQNLDDFRQLVKQREQSHRINLDLERACSFTIKTIRGTLQNLGLVIDVINDTSKLTTALLKLMTHESSDGESTMDHQSYQSQHWSTSSEDATTSSDFEAQDLEQTFLSLQQSLDDAIANREYQTIYGEYTPQSLVQKGKDLAKRVLEWLKSLFQKMFNFITGKSKNLKTQVNELDRGIKECKKLEKEKPIDPEEVKETLRDFYSHRLISYGYMVNGSVDPRTITEEITRIVGHLRNVAEPIMKRFETTPLENYSQNDKDEDIRLFKETTAQWPKKITDFYMLVKSPREDGLPEYVATHDGHTPAYSIGEVRRRVFATDSSVIDKLPKNLNEFLTDADHLSVQIKKLVATIDALSGDIVGTYRKLEKAFESVGETHTDFEQLDKLKTESRRLYACIRSPIDLCTLVMSSTLQLYTSVALRLETSYKRKPDHQSFPRSNTMYTLADAIQAQVTQLAFEEAGIDPDTPLYDIEEADELAANSTIEDREDIVEANSHSQEIQEAHDMVEDALAEAERTGDAVVTMESLHHKLLEAARSHNQLSSVSAYFAQCALGSALVKLNLPRALANDAIPDMQGFDVGQSQATMLGVLSTVADTIFSTWEKVLIGIRKKVGSQAKLLKNLTKRHTKLSAQLQEFKGTAQTGDILSATEENIQLAHELYVGPSNNRTEEIFTRLQALQKLVDRFAHNAVPKMDGLTQQLLNVHPDENGRINTSFTKTLVDIFHDMPGTRLRDPHTGMAKITTPKFIGGVQFDVLVPAVNNQLTLDEFVEMSKQVGFEHFEDMELHAATKETWHNFVLRGMDSNEVRKALDLVGKSIADVGQLEGVFMHQADFGHHLLDQTKKILGSNQNDGSIPRSFVRAVMRIWASVVSGLGFLTGTLMDACSSILTFVGKSMSKWEFYKSRGVGDVVSEVGNVALKQHIAAALPMAVGAAFPIGSMGRIQSAKHLYGMTNTYRAIGGLINVGVGAHRIYRRHAWDNHARAMGHGNQGN